jgi:glucose dehydrogenase
MSHRVSLALVAAAALSAAVVSAQTNWTHVGQDPGGTKYSTLDQINAGNVKSLQKAWTFHTGDKTGFFESTPIVVDGDVMTAQNGVFALDAQTGAQLWKFESDGGTRRGVTYWPGDDKTRRAFSDRRRSD